ncbi:MAG: hypothetical protein ACLFTU_06360 [Puniceicoccaceae bacterium]
MNTKNRILLLLLSAASLLPAGGLGAQEPDRRLGPPSPAEMIERFDANGNGSLEEEELETAFRVRREWIEKRRAGRSGPPEGRLRERRNQRFGDAARGSWVEGRERPSRLAEPGTGDRRLRRGQDGRRAPQSRRAERLVERFDADGDGLLSPREVEDLFAMLRRIQAGRKAGGPGN